MENEYLIPSLLFKCVCVFPQILCGALYFVDVVVVVVVCLFVCLFVCFFVFFVFFVCSLVCLVGWLVGWLFVCLFVFFFFVFFVFFVCSLVCLVGWLVGRLVGCLVVVVVVVVIVVVVVVVVAVVVVLVVVVNVPARKLSNSRQREVRETTKKPLWLYAVGYRGFLFYHFKDQVLPSRELTYPTWGKGKSSSNMPFLGDILVPCRYSQKGPT